MAVILVDSTPPVVDVVAMPPGLNSTHTWLPAGGAPGVVLNSANREVWPRIRIRREIAGWGQPPAGEDRRDPLVGRPLREMPRTSLRRGKTLTYQGLVEARDDLTLRDMVGKLSAAFGDPLMGEGRMVVEPWDGRAAVDYTGRVTGFECPEAVPSRDALGRASRGYERSFTLQLHLAKGRLFSSAQTTVQSGQAVDGVTPAADVARCVNRGTAPTEPKITITANRATETIHNVTTGQLLRFTGLATGGTLVVDFDTRTATRNGVSVRGNLDRTVSNWWRQAVGLRPRLNEIKADGVAAGQMTVVFRSAHY